MSGLRVDAAKHLPSKTVSSRARIAEFNVGYSSRAWITFSLAFRKAGAGHPGPLFEGGLLKINGLLVQSGTFLARLAVLAGKNIGLVQSYHEGFGMQDLQCCKAMISGEKEIRFEGDWGEIKGGVRGFCRRGKR